MTAAKVSILLCILAPIPAITVTRLARADQYDSFGVAPVGAGLAVFTGLTIFGGVA